MKQAKQTNFRETSLRGSLAALTAVVALAGTGMPGTAHAQLVTSWNAPTVDDGNPIPDPVNAWVTNVETGGFVNLRGLAASALAADNGLARLYASNGTSISTYAFDANGLLQAVAGPVGIRDVFGVAARPNQIASLGFANGVLYASVDRSAADAKRKRGIEAGLYAINPATGTATLLKPRAEIAALSGMDYNPVDGFMYGITGRSIRRFDLSNFVLSSVAEVPESAFNGISTNFDGLAVGGGKIYLTTGLNSSYGNVPIVVFDLASGVFEASLPSPPRSAENRSYPAGATFLDAAAAALSADPFAGAPAAPTDMTARNVLPGEVLLTWASSTEGDLAFYRVYRSTDGKAFVELATSTTATYTDRGLGAGETYFYLATAVDTSGLESADSNVAVITLPGGAPPYIAVAAITPSAKLDSFGTTSGRAEVTVVDQLGLPVQGAVVTVSFSGSFNETQSGVTQSNGVALVRTSGRTSGPVAFEACVVGVTWQSTNYDASKNVETCDSY